MVMLGRSCGNPHKHWRIAHWIAGVRARDGASHAGAELPLKAFFPGEWREGRYQQDRGGISMAAGLTKTQLVRQMAEKLELTNKQVGGFFDLLTETAVKETKKNGVFVIPGLGRLVKAERKARMGRNPQTGEAIKIKAKTVVKFRVAKSAKDTIAPPKK
jgi:DNA-binding protein HU-beta